MSLSYHIIIHRAAVHYQKENIRTAFRVKRLNAVIEKATVLKLCSDVSLMVHIVLFEWFVLMALTTWLIIDQTIFSFAAQKRSDFPP